MDGFHDLMLRVVRELGENAYGVPIRQRMSKALGREIAIGTVYMTLERLERQGAVRSFEGEATPKRGGRAKRFFRVVE